MVHRFSFASSFIIYSITQSNFCSEWKITSRTGFEGGGPWAIWLQKRLVWGWVLREQRFRTVCCDPFRSSVDLKLFTSEQSCCVVWRFLVGWNKYCNSRTLCCLKLSSEFFFFFFFFFFWNEICNKNWVFPMFGGSGAACCLRLVWRSGVVGGAHVLEPSLSGGGV